MHSIFVTNYHEIGDEDNFRYDPKHVQQMMNLVFVGRKHVMPHSKHVRQLIDDLSKRPMMCMRVNGEIRSNLMD